MPATMAGAEAPERDGHALDAAFRTYAGRISRHSAVSFAGVLFTVGLGYPFKIYVARVVGADGLGLYTLGMNVVDFLSLFASVGLAAAAGRFVAVYASLGHHRKLRRLVYGGTATVLAAGVVLAAAVVLLRHRLALGVFQEPELAHYLPLFAVLLPLNVGIGFLGQALRGFQEVTRRIVITTFVKFTVRIALTLALFALGWGLLGYIAAELASAVLAILLLALVVRAIMRQRAAGPDAAEEAPGAGREVRDFAASMFFLGLLGFATGKADQVLVGVFLDAGDVGVYMAALGTASFVSIFLRSLNPIFGPVIAGLYAQRKLDLLERLFQISTKWALALTFPGVAVILGFAPELMRIFGPEFEAGAAVLVVAAVAQLINVGVGSVGSILLMSGHQRFEIRAVAATAAVTLTLNLLMIPRFGILGAAGAIAAGVVFSNFLRLYMVHRVLGLTPYHRGYLRLLPPFVLTALTVAGVRWWAAGGDGIYWLGIVVALPLSYLVFLVVTAGLGLDDDDRLIARAVRDRLWQMLPHSG